MNWPHDAALISGLSIAGGLQNLWMLTRAQAHCAFECGSNLALRCDPSIVESTSMQLPPAGV